MQNLVLFRWFLIKRNQLHKSLVHKLPPITPIARNSQVPQTVLQLLIGRTVTNHEDLFCLSGQLCVEMALNVLLAVLYEAELHLELF